MKAITIRQPYASLIMAGIKTVETRSRVTHIRGRILIHAGLHITTKMDPGAFPYVDKLPKSESVHNKGELILWVGHLLGSVEITDCIPAGDWIEERKGKGGGSLEDYEREFVLGDMSSDRFCWILANPEPWKRPYPTKGKQGFWNTDIDFCKYI